MKIVIIGSGNVAWHLIKAFADNGVAIHQVYGRNLKDLEEISVKFNVDVSTVYLKKADLYILAVKDEAITEISKIIINKNALVAHTSGSASINNLRGEYRKAVFYPLQTFSKTKNLVYNDIPVFIEAENSNDLKILTQLGSQVFNSVTVADSDKRKYIHLTAVFACNFTNHLFSKAKEIADLNHIPFEYFLPLINETVQKIKYLDPKEAQTGPAVRGDFDVLDAHRALITDEDAKNIYDTLNQSIINLYKN